MGSSKFSALNKVREEREKNEVRKNADIQVVEHHQPEQPIEEASKRRGRPAGKRSSDDYTQVTAYVRKDTHRDVKIALLQSGSEHDFSDLVQELLSDWLASGQQKH